MIVLVFNMKINSEWHKINRMPTKATLNQRIQWHTDHARECGCREIPPKIKEQMQLRKPKLVVGVLAKHQNKFLLARETLEGGKDYWIVPGGKVEFGESIEDAAKRELKEETGIETKNLKFLCYKEAIFADYNYHTVIFFFETTAKNFDLKEDIEGKVIESKWFTREEVIKLPLVESAEWLFKKVV